MNKKIHARLFQFLHPKTFGYFTRNCHHVTEADTSVLKYPKPNVPLRIKRGPTDILKALAGTVSEDFTAPRYKYHDDPYLYPLSTSEKRGYALSKESGRKTARWIRDTHGEYFNHHPDDPIIESFIPKPKFDENSEVTENDLLNSIKDLEVSESLHLYNLCQSKNVELSTNSRQALLELLSFYNCKNGFDPEWVEEIAHQPFQQETIRKTWKDGNVAEELFQELKENGNLPFCAIIKGMCKYGEVNRAWKLYLEAMDKGLPLDTETFNALIRITSALDNEYSVCWEKAQDLLRKMVELGLPPNLGTMNSLLETVVKLRNWKKEERRPVSLKILSEFKQMGIQPCLASYYYVVFLFHGSKPGTILENVLDNILDDITSRDMTIQDAKDTMFPCFAMDICLKNNLGLRLADRLNTFLQKDNNSNFLGENTKTNLYFRSYMSLAVNSVPLAEFMSTLYDRLVPHIYTPDREVIEEILRNIGVHNELDHLPKVWSDCLLFKKFEKNIMEMFLMVINNYTFDDKEEDSDLNSKLGDIAWDIWNKVEEMKNSKFQNEKIEWSEEMMGDCISGLVKTDKLEKAATIFSNVYSHPSIVAGILPLKTLILLFDATLKEDMLLSAKMVAKYAKENGYPEGDVMTDKISNTAKP